MNKHIIPYSSDSCYPSDDKEYGFADRYSEVCWRRITFAEIEKFRVYFEKNDLSSNIFRTIIKGIVLFLYVILLALYIEVFDFGSVSAVVGAIFAVVSAIMIILYIRDSAFGKKLEMADVCVLPVYETSMEITSTDDVKRENWYAAVFYDYKKIKLRISVSEAVNVTDIMFVNIGGRTEFMPLEVNGHALRYRRTGAYKVYDDSGTSS